MTRAAPKVTINGKPAWQVVATDPTRRRLTRRELYAGCDRAPLNWEKR